MTRYLLALMALIGLTAVSPAFAPVPVYKEPPKPKVPPLFNLMQGTWQLNNQAMGFRGRGGLAFQQTTSIRIQGTSWTYVFTTNGVAQDSTKYEMVLDPKANPPSLDLKYLGQIAAGGSQVALKGIVKVEGDTLTFCYVSGYQQNAVRPMNFAPQQLLPNGTSVNTMTLKKIK